MTRDASELGPFAYLQRCDRHKIAIFGHAFPNSPLKWRLYLEDGHPHCSARS